MAALTIDGKVAVVTGAGQPLGHEIVRLFVEEGARVVASDVATDGMSDLAAAGVETFVADLTRQDEVDRMVDYAVDRFGRLDVLVNSASIGDQSLALVETSDEVWQRVLDFNLSGPYRTCHKAIPIMLRAGSGVIVNVAPLVGGAAAKDGAAATASHRGVVGLTRNIAATFYQSGIRCVVVCPGGGKPSHDAAVNAVERLGGPRDIANIVLFAACDAARYLSGTVITADGGWTAH